MTRSYRLLCPIARALDRIGDRWTLLILRDLHAGPGRFVDLQTALPGLASNLLTTRLRKLEADGLVRRREAEFGTSVYELTEIGERSGGVLFELAAFGAQFPPGEKLRRPGNLRTVAVTLKVACQRVVDPSLQMNAELVIDGERFTLFVLDGRVDVRYGPAGDPNLVVAMPYEALVAVADGRVSQEEFAANHVELVSGEKASAGALLSLMFAAMGRGMD